MLQELACRQAVAIAKVDGLGDVANDVYHFLALVKHQTLLAVVAEADGAADVEMPAVGRQLT